SRRWAEALAPSLTELFFCAMLLWTILGASGIQSLLGDGDTGWHIRTGDYILARHSVPHQDIFTFTRPNDPWFAWEWLSDVVFASLHQMWGLKSVALLAAIVICATATLLLCHMMWSGGNLFLALAGALLANSASSVHFLARPHVFTFLLLAASLWLIA